MPTKLRIISAEQTTITTASATSATTKMLRSRAPERLPVARPVASFSMEFTSSFELLSAGASPKIIPANSAMQNTYASVRRSSATFP